MLEELYKHAKTMEPKEMSIEGVKQWYFAEGVKQGQLLETAHNSDYEKCPKCRGTGKYMYSLEYRGECDSCDGTGHIIASKR